MPLRFGWAASSAEVWLLASALIVVAVLDSQVLDLGHSLQLRHEAFVPWSVAPMPGLTLIAATSPEPPIALTSASAAALPPPRLSVETFVNASGFEMKVSTVATGIPALTARWMGEISAVLSVGAIRIASGCSRSSPR